MTALPGAVFSIAHLPVWMRPWWNLHSRTRFSAVVAPPSAQ
ncbi:hypothetical protein [Glycomyces halotolerans]